MSKNKSDEPYVGVDEFGFIPEELKAKDRWAGVRLESYPKFMEVIRLKYVDTKTGWGASADNPDSLTSLSNVVHARRAGKIHHFVYLPEPGDNMEAIEEMNKQLCPVDLPADNQPTYKEILTEDPMHIDYAKMGRVDIPDLVPHLAQLVMLHIFYENSIAGQSIKTLTHLLNKQQVSGREKIVYEESWVQERLEKAFEGKQHIMVYSLLVPGVRVSRMTEPPLFPRPSDIEGEVWYQFERLP